MKHKTYAVLVRTDEQDRIIAINSSAFVTDVDGWVQIDEGDGDRYHHAQGNYLPMPLTDDRGVYRYKLADGHAVERTQEEMDGDYTQPEETPTLESRVGGLETEVAALKTGLAADNADMTAALNLLGVERSEV